MLAKLEVIFLRVFHSGLIDLLVVHYRNLFHNLNLSSVTFKSSKRYHFINIIYKKESSEVLNLANQSTSETMRRTPTTLFVLLGFAIPHCQAQINAHGHDGSTFLGRVFGGVFSDGIIALLPTPDITIEGTDQTSATSGNSALSDQMQLLTCTQSTACYSESTQTPGAWTCRPQPIGHVSICVPTILGITLGREGDTCGCCDGICPKKCECGCVNARGVEGVMARFNLLFGLIQFDQCLEPTVADAATSFTTLDISCSEVCEQQGGGGYAEPQK